MAVSSSFFGSLWRALTGWLRPPRAWLRPPRAFWRTLRAFSAGDRAAGVTLVVATIAALGWASAWPGPYERIWDSAQFVPRVAGLHFSLRDWADQGLMTMFFAGVGLEVRLELSPGGTMPWKSAAVPVFAALGGMAAPAVIYTLVVHGGAGSRGWGIPMATDVAFALGVLDMVAASRAPRARVFLMALAVADDIFSIIILVFFYSSHLDVAALLVGLAAVAGVVGARRLRPAWTGLQLSLWALAWWGLARGGVEAAVLGVAIGALVLRSPRRAEQAQLRGPRDWEVALQPWLVLLVLPVFALANVGIPLGHLSLSAKGAPGIFLAVLVARVVGKPAGIAMTTWALRRASSRLADAWLSARELSGVGALASVGFTVPLLVVRAALPDGAMANSATLGLLAGSVVGALGGFAIMRTRTHSVADGKGDGKGTAVMRCAKDL